MNSDSKNKRFTSRSVLGDRKVRNLPVTEVGCSPSVVKASRDLGRPHTGPFTRHRYLTRDRSGAPDRSLTCDRFFEEAGNALS